MKTSANTVLLLHNPRSGARQAGDIIAAHRERLQHGGLEVLVLDNLDQLPTLAREWQHQGRLHSVIAAGGDGTAAAVAARVPETIPLWLCPLGTENLLAKHLGMTADPNQALESLRRRRTRQLDAGLANGQLFLIMVSIGFDAEVVRLTHTARRGHINRWHYAWSITRAILHYRFPLFQVQTWMHPGQPPRIDTAAWCFCMVVPRYADGLAIAPMANEADGRIDVCTFRQGGLWKGWEYLRAVRRGRHQQHPDFQHRLAERLSIDTHPSIPAIANLSNVPFQRDGDFGGYLPLTVEVLPQRLTIIAPVPGS
jgi:diacylglycerol kinase (ATP)